MYLNLKQLKMKKSLNPDFPPTFIGIWKKEEPEGVMKVWVKDYEAFMNLVDSFFDHGYTIKKISEQEYDDFDLGDEVTINGDED